MIIFQIKRTDKELTIKFFVNRTIDPKPCNPRTLQKPKKGGGYPKVFLGGLPSNVTETDLRTFFTRFGKVMEVVIMYDQEKKKSRGGTTFTCLGHCCIVTYLFFLSLGFGFLSFEDEDAVDRCVAEHFVNLNGKQVSQEQANVVFFLQKNHNFTWWNLKRNQSPIQINYHDKQT